MASGFNDYGMGNGHGMRRVILELIFSGEFYIPLDIFNLFRFENQGSEG